MLDALNANHCHFVSRLRFLLGHVCTHVCMLTLAAHQAWPSLEVLGQQSKASAILALRVSVPLDDDAMQPLQTLSKLNGLASERSSRRLYSRRKGRWVREIRSLLLKHPVSPDMESLSISDNKLPTMKATKVILALAMLFIAGTNARRDVDHLYADDPV